MTMTNTLPGSRSDVVGADPTRTARTTGLLYLGLAITGVLGSILVRAELYAAGDPQGTLSNLVDHATLARLGIVLELGIVLTQALAALWFYRLFRSVDSLAAAATRHRSHRGRARGRGDHPVRRRRTRRPGM